MKRFICLAFLFSCVYWLPIHAQQCFFYDKNSNKIYLDKIDSLIFINHEYSESLESENETSNQNISNLKKCPILSRTQYSAIRKRDIIEQELPVYRYYDGTLQVPNGNLFICVKGNYDIYAILEDLHISYKTISIVPNLEHTFEVSIVEDAIEAANAIFETGKVVFAEPSFTRFVKLNTVPNNYHLQWGLNNTGQYGGTNGIDINTSDAWNVTKGNTNIKVAVLDVGVDLNHSDLNLSSGFDAVPSSENVSGANGAPANRMDDAHGTACAGIISALDNNSGCVGVSPNSKVMPVRIGYADIINNQTYLHTEDSWILSAFNLANNNGASIISCSFSLGTPSSVIADKINTLVSSGRNGNGCIIVVSSGNNNSTSINPLATSSVIVVGAMSQCGQRKSPNSCDGENWGSNYGSALDIVAPGVKIYTTDISGDKGYNSSSGENGDYNTNFNGTSAACPHVAGVAALVLSVDPNLSAQEVRRIIESTAQKIGNYNYSYNSNHPNGTWNNEMGYGLIDAKAAVLRALNMTLSGPDILCPYDGSFTYSISNVPSNATVTWTCSGGASLSGSNTGASCSVKGTTPGHAHVKAVVNINGTTVEFGKNLEIASTTGNPYLSYTSDDRYIYLKANTPNIYGIRQYMWNATSIGGGGSSQSSTTGPGGDYWSIPKGCYNVECRIVTQCVHMIATTTIGGYRSTVYPNPVDNTLHIDIVEPQETDKITANSIQKQVASNSHELRLFNFQGNLVRNLRTTECQISIDVSGLPEGNYFLHIIRIGSTEPEVHKVIISH